ncbi:sugar O-acetyltransferase [Sphingomonas populi]|uniref:Nodulation protein L n=1 Tax=Sphingomonas populi TaxID=2484750 RepID=A0A4Q6XUN7_9SPHN|nr:sugar O-acetyltransferase [Sphingomonas populi]RZF63635.1 sugar O-acetyltransferase [Sphingomonas populi]
MSMTQKQKMLAGELYIADDPELVADAARAAAWMDRYNAASAASAADRYAMLVEGLGHVGGGVVVRSPFHCDYGYNVHLEDGVFLNFGCIVLDVVAVRIGTGTLIGPGVQILTAEHPRDAAVRSQKLEYGRSVTIGRNVWIGAGALILPGVSIGDDAIIGAGSVVTCDVAPNTTVVGNPASPVK